MTAPAATEAVPATSTDAAAQHWPDRAGVELPPPPVGEAWQVVTYAHTHWDREWYQPFERFRMQLVAAVDRILDTLAADPSFPVYVLDGQTSVLDDYLEIRPERREELAALVRSGRLEVGPWYILPDEFLVSGESFVRNLLEGRRMAREIGAKYVPIGYLPDPFGHVAQLPAILDGFGIDTVVFSRGMGNEFAGLGSEFEWVGSDGESMVTAVVQSSPRTNGYCNAERLAKYHRPEGDEPWTDIEDLTRHLAGAQARAGIQVFSAGCDHETINPALPAMVATLDRALTPASVRIGGLGDIAAAARDGLAARRAAGLEVGRFQGELRGAWHAPILAAIFSARVPLKQDNVLLQAWLERYVEPIVALAALTGVHDAPQSFVRHAWRLALQNQPHDSIGGCSVDLVHEEMPARTMRALELCQGLLEEVLIEAGAADEHVLFHPQPHVGGGIAVRDGVPVWTGELAPLSLTRWSDAVAGGAAAPAGGARMLDAGGDRIAGIATDRIRVEVRRPGTGGGAASFVRGAAGAVLRSGGNDDLASGPEARVEIVATAADGSEQVHLVDALQYVDEADAGDEYDFGAIPGDRPLRARIVHAEARMGEGGVAELRVVHVVSLPESLTPDRQRRAGHAHEHEIETILRVAGDLPWVEATTRLENYALDHRLRLHVPLGGTVETAIVDGHFAITERPATPVAPVGGTTGDWAQQPPPANHCESLAAVASVEGPGVALLTRGLHEYEVTSADLATRHAPGGRLTSPVANAALELTLLRSVGWLSRDDIPGRPGHAGPGVETPGAQCIGGHELEFAILPFAGSWQDAGLARAARRFAAPPLAIAPVHEQVAQMTGHVARVRDLLGAGDTEGDLSGPADGLARFAAHGVRIEGDIELSALTRSDDGSGDLVLRVFNPQRAPQSMRLHVGPGITAATWVRLDEQPVADAPDASLVADGDGSVLEAEVPAGAIRTVRLHR